MSPTGIIAPASDPYDGLWVGGGADPNDFVPPAGANYIDPDKNPRAAAHIERAWRVVDEQWSKDFCANQCESRWLYSLRAGIWALVKSIDLDLLSRLH